LYVCPLTGNVTAVAAAVVDTVTVPPLALSAPCQPTCTGWTVYCQLPSGTPASVHEVPDTVPAHDAPTAYAVPEPAS